MVGGEPQNTCTLNCRFCQCFQSYKIVLIWYQCTIENSKPNFINQMINIGVLDSSPRGRSFQTLLSLTALSLWHHSHHIVSSARWKLGASWLSTAGFNHILKTWILLNSTCYVTSRSESSRHFTHSVYTQVIRYPYVFWWIYNLQYLLNYAKFCEEIFSIDLKYDFLSITKVFIK